MSWSRRIRSWLRLRPQAARAPAPLSRGRVDHVVILDGTMASLERGFETNAGTTYRLLLEVSGRARLSLLYEAGVQWCSWRSLGNVITGRGINGQIRRAYGFIASRYRPGDRIFLFGYSRGAYAARSLAGVIDRIGLLRAHDATERNIRQAWRHYQYGPDSDAARAFARAYCHEYTGIEMVGVWDTVKSLGLHLPVVWRLTESRYAFHSHHLGASVRYGYQALALNETRQAFAPVLWNCPENWRGVMEQVWFRGSHGDIGGQLDGYEAARPLANIPLVWMLERAEGCGLAMPDGWRGRFDQDVGAPSVGSFRSWGKFFLFRRRRRIGRDRSESLHPSARGDKRAAAILTGPSNAPSG